MVDPGGARRRYERSLSPSGSSASGNVLPDLDPRHGQRPWDWLSVVFEHQVVAAKRARAEHAAAERKSRESERRPTAGKQPDQQQAHRQERHVRDQHGRRDGRDERQHKQADAPEEPRRRRSARCSGLSTRLHRHVDLVEDAGDDVGGVAPAQTRFERARAACARGQARPDSLTSSGVTNRVRAWPPRPGWRGTGRAWRAGWRRGAHRHRSRVARAIWTR